MFSASQERINIMENLQPKTFNIKCRDIDCTLVPEGSAFLVYSTVGQKNKETLIGLVENMRLLEVQHPEMQDLLLDIAEKIALN